MKKLLEEIFKLYPPYKIAVGNDSVALILNAIGNSMIALTFIIIGVICIIKSSDNGKVRSRQNISKLFGIFILTCGLSRGVDMLSIWYNYAVINGILKIMTGITASITVGYIPYLIRTIKQSDTIEEVKDKMQLTSDRIDKLQQTANDRFNK